MTVEQIKKIHALKKPLDTIDPSGYNYNQAIDDVIEILAGQKPTEPRGKCIECIHMLHNSNDPFYYCRARDDLGGKDGEIGEAEIEYPCPCFFKK